MSSFRSISILGAPHDGKATISMASNALNVSTTLAAPLFVGNGSGLTNVTLTNATLINVDVIGNITGANVVSTSFVRAPTAYADLSGNVDATYVNATANIRTSGNAFATRFFGDHVGNLIGNVYATSADVSGITTAGFFVGNGALLTGITAAATLPAVSMTDVLGNVDATYVNATANIKTDGNVLATNLFGNLVGNVTATDVDASSNVNATFVNATANVNTGNVNATFVNATANIKADGFFVGNGSFLTGITAVANVVFPATLAIDITGNVTATYVNATANIRTTGNVLALNVDGNLAGNVTATFVNATANIRTTGNMFAANFYGDSIGNVTATFVNATANIKTTGNVIVGNALSFGSRVQNNLITLYGNTNSVATDFFGFGVTTGNVRYQANSTSAQHTFWCGTAQVAAFRLYNSIVPTIRLLPPTPTTQQAAMLYNDGSEIYIMTTAVGDPGGSYTSTRPIFFNLATGNATLGGDTTLSGNTSIATGKILSFGSSQNCIVNLYPGGTTDATTTAFYGFGVENGNTLRHQAASGGTQSFLFGTSVIASMYSADTDGWNAASTAMGVAKFGVTGRSINASGTINASGADYAEYMTKAGDFEIPKGAIVGVNADGLLTNRFADSVTFAIKSTDPSLVGGDSWGMDAAVGIAKPRNVSTERAPGEDGDEWLSRVDTIARWTSRIEAARARVDRVAFSGQVPCNVLGATPGQYVVPCDPGDGSIAGRAVTDPELADYRRAVGVVAKVLDDGRAFVFVKVG